jgi:hypothetical protein
MTKDLDALLRQLDEIDAQADHVAKGNQSDPDLSVLAWSIHHLVEVVRDLAAGS